GIHPYDWQCRILLNYEAGYPTAAAAANFSRKTSTVFPICALWTLANFPTARVMYLSATGSQVEKQFFAALNRFPKPSSIRKLELAHKRGEDQCRRFPVRTRDRYGREYRGNSRPSRISRV